MRMAKIRLLNVLSYRHGFSAGHVSRGHTGWNNHSGNFCFITRTHVARQRQLHKHQVDQCEQRCEEAGTAIPVHDASLIGLFNRWSKKSFALFWWRPNDRQVAMQTGFGVYSSLVYSTCTPRLRRFSTKRGWARRIGVALRIFDLPSMLDATKKSAIATRMM